MNPINHYIKSQVCDFIWNELLQDDFQWIAYIKEWPIKSFYQFECDDFGNPKFPVIKLRTINRIDFKPIAEDTVLKPITIKEKSIRFTSPLVVMKISVYPYHRVLIWEARMDYDDWNDIDSMKTLDLQKIVTESIERKTCKIINRSDEIKWFIEEL